MSSEAFHFEGVVLPDEEHRRVGVVSGRITFDPPSSSRLIESGVWMIPGFVDAHCHVGLDDTGAVSPEIQERQALTDRRGGTLTIRDCGVPADTRWIDGREDLPQILRHGRHIARPMRHTRDIGLEVEPDELVATVEAEIARGDGWIKLVGDWIDRGRGDLAPLWPADVLKAAIDRAHELGARVTAHTFSEEAPRDLILAGIDCLEHGTGLTHDLVELMVEHDVALVPTLINIARFPEIADSGAKYPMYAEHMRALHTTAHERVRHAYESGVRIFAGTDAGSAIAHGRIADEIRALHQAGLSTKDALGAASWRAREWLGVEHGLVEGSIANFNVYDADPYDLAALSNPLCVVLKGNLQCG